MVLHKSKCANEVDKITKEVNKLLVVCEKNWTDAQKELQRKRIEQKHAKRKRQMGYVDKLLRMCKSWGGPCTSIAELELVLKANGALVEKIVKTELSYYKHTHRADIIARPNLFKLVKVMQEERVENLCVLLTDDSRIASTASSDATRDLPSNEDAMHLLSAPTTNQEIDTSNNITFKANQLCVTVWNDGDMLTWYVGYWISMNDDGTYVIEHLHRVKENSDLYWMHPSTEDIDTDMEDSDIFPIIPIGDWEINDTDMMRFRLKNGTDIRKMFKKYTEEAH